MKAQDFEALTLAGFIRNRSSFEKLAGELTPDAFTEPKLRTVFDAMLKLGPEFSVPELANEVDAVGGISLVRDLANSHRRYGTDKAYPIEQVRKYAQAVDRLGRQHQMEVVLQEGWKQVKQAKGLKFKDEEFVGALVQTLVELQHSSTDRRGFRTYDWYMGRWSRTLKRTMEGLPPEDRLPTGFRSFDRATGGGLPEGLVVIGGLPGSGKTQVALEIGVYNGMRLRDNGLPGTIGLNSAEMSGESLISRSILSAAEIDSAKLRQGGYKNDPEALERIKDQIRRHRGIPLMIDDSDFLTSNIIAARVSGLKAAFGKVVLVITDFAELIHDKGDSIENRVATVFINAKALAKRLRCTVILLSQLSRSVEASGTRVPSMRHLRYSGMAEAVADMILLIYNPNAYIESGIKITNHPDMPPMPDTSYLILAKNREGPVGFMPMGWIGRYARWFDLSTKTQLKTYSE